MNRSRAIKLWISKNSEVSVREQLIAQISLGITSGDLKAGEKLPSTRELARRFQIHQNTISAAYRQLVEQNLVELRKGSGVYVCEKGNTLSRVSVLDKLINEFFQKAGAKGFSNGEIKTALQKYLSEKPSTNFIVVESEPNLRRILIEEIYDAIKRQVSGISLEDLNRRRAADEAEVWLMFDKPEFSQKTLPPNVACVFLKANSVSASMIGKQRPAENDLIAVVSDWEKFLTLAKMFLLAAGIAPETLVLRSTSNADWKNGLQAASMIICDSAAAKKFPGDDRIRIFRLIADSSLEEIKNSAG